VIPIKAPPLRERLEDIPALVQHFVAQFSRENNRRPARFSQQSIEALKQARWRGNIRELKNVVERLLIMSDRDVIDGDDVRAVVPTVVRTDASASLGSGSAASPVVTGAATLRAFKGVRARLAGRQAPRARMEYLQDRRRDRHPSQQPLQEA
jgi:DNA-binding NtrC family response regulator